MQERKPFKPSPKKFHPRGIKILYEDWDLLVIDKPAGMLSVNSEMVTESAQSMLNDYVRKNNSKSKERVYVISPLDKETSGILVFAKTIAAKDFLSEKWPDFKKKYIALVQGKPKEDSGVITTYLRENSIHLMYSVSDPGMGVFARTSYTVLKSSATHALVEVNPMTERKHQARLHLADLGCPVAGDKKYGKRAGLKRMCLHLSSIEMVHPFTKEPLTFKTQVSGYFNTILKG